MSLLIPDMAEEDTQAAVERINGYISGISGELKSTSVDSPWGRRRLAYTMRHQGVDYRDGFYVLSHFSATPESLVELERDLKLDNQVIRYLLVMDDPKAGEKNTQQDGESAEDAEPAASTEQEPAEQAEAQETASTETSGTDQKPAEAEEAPATEQANEAASDEAIENKTEDAAETIQGEEAPAPADAPAPKRSSKLPTEGEGSEWVAGDGTDNVPEDFPIKGNTTSKIYHPQESPNYSNTTAEIYFASGEAAESHGYRLPKTLQAANAAANAADAASEEE